MIQNTLCSPFTSNSHSFVQTINSVKPKECETLKPERLLTQQDEDDRLGLQQSLLGLLPEGVLGELLKFVATDNGYYNESKNEHLRHPLVDVRSFAVSCFVLYKKVQKLKPLRAFFVTLPKLSDAVSSFSLLKKFYDSSNGICENASTATCVHLYQSDLPCNKWRKCVIDDHIQQSRERPRFITTSRAAAPNQMIIDLAICHVGLSIKKFERLNTIGMIDTQHRKDTFAGFLLLEQQRLEIAEKKRHDFVPVSKRMYDDSFPSSENLGTNKTQKNS